MEQNLKEVLDTAKATLKSSGVPDNRDAEFILEYVLDAKLTALQGRRLTHEELAKFTALIQRRVSREPLDSILGGTEFLGLEIPFNKLTLTPRQETEIMTDSIIRENRHRKGLKVLDLCSGSGCIGLAIAKALPDSIVTLVDISEDTLNIARENARRNNVNVKFLKSDLFENIEGRFDIIISNPPYIPTGDISSLEKEVLDYDPVLALDGGKDGLDLYRQMAQDVDTYLNKNGLVYMEFGMGQSADIIDIFKDSLDNIEIIKDYSGIDRYLKARKKNVN